MNNEETIAKKEPYFGSVRFFKQLFITIFILLITVPTIISIVLTVRVSGLKRIEKELRLELENDTSKSQTDSAFPSQEISPELPAYLQLYPDFYASPTEYSSIYLDKSCYLTFDDGPGEHTTEILNILEEKNVFASFFVTKQDTETGRLNLKAIADAGHTIGMHSASHDYAQIYTSVENFLSDYYELFTWIKDVTGQTPTTFRFPGGSVNTYNRLIYREIIAEMTRRGFVFFDWNLSAGDAYSKTSSTTQIKYNCLNQIEDFNRIFVQMHDGNEENSIVEALPDIIDGYLEKGFTVEKITPEVTPIAFTYPD